MKENRSCGHPDSGADCSETWGLNAREKRRLNVMEIKCLRSICGVIVKNRIRNEEIRRRVGVQVDLLGRAERCEMI